MNLVLLGVSKIEISAMEVKSIEIIDRQLFSIVTLICNRAYTSANTLLPQIKLIRYE